MGRPSFTALQSIVAMVAGLTSIGGVAYSVVSKGGPAPGDVVVMVRDAQAGTPVRGASVELLADDGALVTELTPTADGLARRQVAAGAYRLRVAHPQFAETTRDVRVLPGETAEVHLVLSRRDAAEPRTTSAPREARARGGSASPGATLDRGVNATRRFFARLGF